MIDSLPHRRRAAIAQSARLVARVGLLLTFAFASCKPMWAGPPNGVDRLLKSLKAGSEVGAAVLVQAAECTSREGDLRLIRRQLAPSRVGLLNTGHDRPDSDLVDLVRDRLGVSESAVVQLHRTSSRTLRELGVTRTPVLVVWNDRHSVLLATSVSTDRRLLRHQLIAARLLLTLE